MKIKKEKILYAITSEDILKASDELGIAVSSKDYYYIGDKLGDYFGDQWHDAIEYALMELKNKN